MEPVSLRYSPPLVNTALVRTLAIYAVILPLAVILGWLAVDLADWERTSFTVFAAVGFVLLLPLLLKWHYPVLVMSWATFVQIFFLPGKPSLWMLMAFLTVGIAIVNRIIQKKTAFLSAPLISVPLLLLGAVVLITAKLRGGFGLSAVGSTVHGGKAYYYIIAAIIGYFAFATQRIPVERAKLYVGFFFLSALLSAGSHLIYWAGPAFYFLFLLFPAGFAAVQHASEQGGEMSISRIAGFGVAAASTGFYLLAVNGIRGVLKKWWRILLLVTVVGFGLMSGFRSTLVLFGLVFVILFFMEGLLRSPIFPAILLAGGLAFAMLLPFSTSLPRSMQRSLSFLPIEVSPMVRADADSSIEWRLQMWRAIVPDLPKYIWLGKGYAQNPTDIYLTQQAVLRGRSPNYAGALLSGDYHSGPLSVYVPFGSFGAAAFLIFVVCSLRALHLNYRYGSEELRLYNRFLYAYFLARIIFFLAAFGALSYELYVFTGIIGLSVALNGGVCRKPAFAPQPVSFRRNFVLRPSRSGAA